MSARILLTVALALGASLATLGGAEAKKAKVEYKKPIPDTERPEDPTAPKGKPALSATRTSSWTIPGLFFVTPANAAPTPFERPRAIEPTPDATDDAKSADAPRSPPPATGFRELPSGPAFQTTPNRASKPGGFTALQSKTSL